MVTLNTWNEEEESIEARRYCTLPEAIQTEIIVPIEAGGAVESAEDEFDVDAIAEKVLVFVKCEDGEGLQHGNVFWTARPSLDPSEFWEIVKESAR